ncbi:MAG: hypothetical protein ACYDG4_16145 [Desulfuromonadaceae bacterium]
MTKMVAPEKCFQLYLAVKNHFTVSRYDAVKYNARVKGATLETLLSRNDSGLICRLSKKFKTVPETASFFVANMAYGNEYPFDDEERSFKLYNRWQKNRQSLTKMFKDDCSVVTDSGISWQDLISTSDIPPLFMMMKNGKVNIETLAILNILNPFVDSWMKNHPLWKSDFLRIKKLSSFIKFDKDKFKALYLEQMHDEVL